MQHKQKVIFGLIGLLLCLAVIGAVYMAPGREEGNKLQVDVYFLNPQTQTLEPETHFIDMGENNQMAEAVLKLLYNGPKSKNLVKTFPDDVAFLDGRVVLSDVQEEGLLEVEFSKEYMDMLPTAEQYFRASLVWSMTELPFIKDVVIYTNAMELARTDGLPMGRLNRSNMVINPVISPSKVDVQRVRLYFYSTEDKMLAPEERNVQVNPDWPIEKYIVEQLIAGPRTKGFVAIMPPETKIRGDVKTEDKVCYVNLSSDFASKTNATGDLLLYYLYGVVNSLTELPDVDKVQFLIESEKIENYKGTLDLSKPIERDERFIVQQQEP